MIILHAGLIEGRLLLWGEKTVPVPSPARRGRNRAPRFLPFAAGIDDLAAVLSALLSDWQRPRRGSQPAYLWLPTVQRQPVASSPLIAEPPAADGAAVLAAWLVPVLSLTPEQAVEFLAACLDQTSLAPGVLLGATLGYWATALRFAGALAAREQFLPDVEQVGQQWRSSWKPTLSGTDGMRFNRLAQAMPGACRALSETADAAPEHAPAAVLSEFMTLVIDAIVRASGPSVPVPRQQKVEFDSLHDQWLHSLRAGDGSLRGTAGELAKLAEQVHSWRRPAALSAGAPYRLCFRLEEPPAHETAVAANPGPWTVRYLLQAQDDPSLLIPVTEAWAPQGRSRAVLQRNGFQPREFLLAALGQAASLCPEVEASLKASAPAAFATDAGGAQRFLTETAWQLEQAGFGVLLPAWWTGKGTKQRLTVRARFKSPPMQGGSGLTLESLVQFEWQVALGDFSLTLQELQALARLKVPLVQVRGQWVQVNAEEIQAALDLMKSKKDRQAPLRELTQMALGARTTPGGLGISGVTATGWVDDFLSQLQGQASFAELPSPQGFQGTLRPYQLRGFSWLAFLRRWGLGACLADDMGLGKTVQTLALIQRDWEADGRRPVLLIAPMSVVGNWKKEAERFTPDLPVLVHHGLKRAKGGTFAKEARQHALVLSSYGLLHRDLDQFQKVSWGGVILDEAQNIKNPETKQAKAARVLEADYRVALTGTPVENHVGDLWSIWQFLNPGFLGSQTEFRRAFFVPIQVLHDPDATERLRRLTGPFLLRRLKTDNAIIADLPDKLEMKVYCNLTREQASLYEAVVEDLDRQLHKAEGIQRKGIILGTLSKLKQVCNHPAQFLGDNSPIPGRSGKLARLTEMLDEVLQAGDRALVFTQFTEMGGLIQRHLQETFGREVLFLHGGVARTQRDRMVARFQSETDGPRVFLLSLKAGGTGLNLTAANHVFHFDRWWNPAVENQATDRAFRIGQTRNVQVHKFLCVGTLEEKIDEMLERKQEVAARVVGTGEAWLTELSNDQLKDLLTLRQEALAE